MIRKQPAVTFIIPTLNAADHLPVLLSSIRSQNYPKSKIEIIVADGGSTDNTVIIARQAGARIIKNPDIIHEPGKTLASRAARGEILFFTDADNELATADWLNLMVKPLPFDNRIMGYLPQTVPNPGQPGICRYLGRLFTDPFTWFIYGSATNPKYYGGRFKPLVCTRNYSLYRFPPDDCPLFGLSQGAGTHKSFCRKGPAVNDDITAGISLIRSGGIVKYVPGATLFHHHVIDLRHFIRKYSERINGNFKQKLPGMGIRSRSGLLSRKQRIRMYLFVPYALSGVLPLFDAVRLAVRERDPVMFWHLPSSVIMGLLILWKTLRNTSRKRPGNT